MKEVLCHVGVVRGGIGINYEYPDIAKEDFGLFLRNLKSAAGFAQPRLVELERNNPDGSKPKWTQLRISKEDCELFGVSLRSAIFAIKAFLESAETRRKYKVRFQVTISPPAV